MAEPKLYARPDGWHYHTDRNCPMLAGGEFERLGYKEITLKQAKKRRLNPCACTEPRHIGYSLEELDEMARKVK